MAQPQRYQMLRQTMLDPLKWKYKAQAGLLVSAIAGTAFGVAIAYQSGNGWLGTFIWALIGTVAVGGAFYFDRVTR
jgi:high-affinity Fe2+/Pb2+ permease